MKSGDIYTLKEDGSLVIVTGFEQLTWSVEEITILNFKGESSNTTIGKLDIKVGHIRNLLKFPATIIFDMKTKKTSGVIFPVEEHNIN